MHIPLTHFAYQSEVDCPIEGPIWEALSERTARDVIIEVTEKASPVIVASIVNRDRSGASTVILDNYVFTTVTAREALTKLLPLTSWRGFLLRVRTKLEPSWGEGDDGWSIDDSVRLAWLVRQVLRATQPTALESLDHVLQLGDTSGGYEVPEEVPKALLEAADLADASEVHPVASVSLNRTAERA